MRQDIGCDKDLSQKDSFQHHPEDEWEILSTAEQERNDEKNS